jgi:hypothetical protein
VVGDGIREDLAPLAEILQSHAGQRFTFALVEMGIYETPQAGVRIVVPSILAQTRLIERGVLQIEDGKDGSPSIVVREPVAPPASGSRDRSIGIGEDDFYDFLEQRAPGGPTLLKSFLAKAEALGVYVDRQAGLNLKHAAPQGNALNLGSIDKNGYLDTGPATWWGRTNLGRRYNETLASMIGGFVRDMKEGQQSAVRTAAGKMPRISDLLPKHQEAWLSAIDRYVRESFESASED